MDKAKDGIYAYEDHKKQRNKLKNKRVKVEDENNGRLFFQGVIDCSGKEMKDGNNNKLMRIECCYFIN